MSEKNEQETTRMVQTGSQLHVNHDEIHDDGDQGDSPLFDWFMSSPSLPRVLLIINTVLLVALVLIMIVVYVRVQSALQAVDNMSALMPNFPK